MLWRGSLELHRWHKSEKENRGDYGEPTDANPESAKEGGIDAGNPTAESLHMEIPKATMARLANILTSMVDRPVVDRTGLTGTYEIGFDVPSQDVRRAVMMPMPGKIPRAASPPEDQTGGSIFQSVQSLGLRLEKDKAAVETIVVDHIEKAPTEN